MTRRAEPSILVLAGGPDAERGVSLVSARAVAQALGERAMMVTIETLTIDELRALPGDIIFPVLHGPWGEGGELQDLLERDGRPFVGSGSNAARLAMDKLATKLSAALAGISTAPACMVLPSIASDAPCPLGLPVVVKPVCDGSSFGMHLCVDQTSWWAALADVRAEPCRPWMAERFVHGRELTVGVVQDATSDRNAAARWRALPIVEIRAAGGMYDHDAKYVRGDTVYVIDPALPAGVAQRLQDAAVMVCMNLGVRHLARVDFMLGMVSGTDAASESGASGTGGVSTTYLLEVNTMPGFTPTSLLPKASAAVGMDFASLCRRLVDLAGGSVMPDVGRVTSGAGVEGLRGVQ